MWGLSVQSVVRIFKNEPGVLEFGSPETRFKRGYVMLRIPKSVLERVHTRLHTRAT